MNKEDGLMFLIKFPKKLTSVFLLLVLLLASPLTTINVHSAVTPSKHIVGYFTNWSIYRGHNNYYPQDIPFDKVTHINYAFAGTSNGKIVLTDPFADINKMFDGDVSSQPLKGCFHQFEIYKAKYPNFKLLISVGGWSCSAEFSDIALTDASRTIFADSLVDFLHTYKMFDGIDIDWEYPVSGGLPTNTYRPEDNQNFTLLMAKIREKLNLAGAADGKTYLLTAAMPAGYDIMNNFEIGQLAQYVDWFNLMTYDYHGVWDTVTNHHSPLYANSNDPNPDPDKKTKLNTDWTVNAYLAEGVPADKLNVGVPYYSRGWAGVTGGTNGLFGNLTGGAPGIWDDRGTNAGINPF
jgi:chitinase